MSHALSILKPQALIDYLTDADNKKGNCNTRRWHGSADFYLNAIKFIPGKGILGMLGGPNKRMSYKLLRNGSIKVLSSNLSPIEEAAIFLEIQRGVQDRIRQGFPKNQKGSNYTASQFYLKRGNGSMKNPKVKAALKAKKFQSRFLKRVFSWGFVLVNP